MRYVFHGANILCGLDKVQRVECGRVRADMYNEDEGLCCVNANSCRRGDMRNVLLRAMAKQMCGVSSINEKYSVDGWDDIGEIS